MVILCPSKFCKSLRNLNEHAVLASEQENVLSSVKDK